MIYVYDIWVNWFEGEEAGYNVCHYHEWRKTDEIEILEQIPLLYLPTALYHRIENSLHDIPGALLKQIYKRTFLRKGHKREVIDYAAIITDGKGILAFDTASFQIPIKKSRLIPRHEYKVYELMKRMKKFKYAGAFLEKPKYKLVQDNGQANMVGLTRRERQLKKILFIALEQLKTSHNKEELMYWLGEWDINQLEHIHNQMTPSALWQMLYDEVSLGWSQDHERLCAQIIKGKPLLEKYWETEKQEQLNHLQK